MMRLCNVINHVITYPLIGWISKTLTNEIDVTNHVLTNISIGYISKTLTNDINPSYTRVLLREWVKLIAGLINVCNFNLTTWDNQTHKSILCFEETRCRTLSLQIVFAFRAFWPHFGTRTRYNIIHNSAVREIIAIEPALSKTSKSNSLVSSGHVTYTGALTSLYYVWPHVCSEALNGYVYQQMCVPRIGIHQGYRITYRSQV